MRTRALLVLLLCSLAACEQEPTSPLFQATVAGLFTEGAALEVGEVLTVAAGETQAIFLTGGDNGAEYLYVPFNASEVATARLRVEVQGGNVVPPTDLTSPARAPVPSAAFRSALAASGLGRDALPRPDDEFHERLRQREIEALRPLVRSGAARGADQAQASAPADRRSVLGLPANPQVGDTLTINTNPRQACELPDPSQGRVVAVSDRAIVVEDLENPIGGFSQAEFQNIAMVFDTLIYPVDVRNFGDPAFADFITPQERIVIFYTVAVNKLTEPGSRSFVGGFFFARDLFPRQTVTPFTGCPASNEAPIMYLLAPDPTGELGNVRTREFVLRTTLSTVAHEFQHLINAARRLFVVQAEDPFEEVWLNEGLSHVAEELMFYNSTGLSPRENIGIPALTASPHLLQQFFIYQANNFGRFISYLEEPDTNSLLGIDNLPTRGASWAFVRYAADQEPGPDALFFRKLVDGRETGVPNLRNALAVDPIDLMQTWTVSVFTDDALPAVPFPVIFQMPSWNFREIITAFRNAQGERIFDEYPLNVRVLTERETRFDLLGGGAAFLRFAVPAGGRASLVTTSGGAVPGDRLRISVVRLR